MRSITCFNYFYPALRNLQFLRANGRKLLIMVHDVSNELTETKQSLLKK